MSSSAVAAKRALIGRPLETGELEERLLPKYLALPIFSSDPISSVAYATEAALAVLVSASLTAAHLVLPISIAIDHHPPRPGAREATFTDVRTDYGATSTMLFYYLKAAGIDLPTKLATALLIGIKSDTRGLEREASEADLHAYLEIFPRADLTLMARIESPRIPQRYFEAFHEALEVSALYDGVLVADVGDVAEREPSLPDTEAHRIVGVMGRAKELYRQPADLDAGSGAHADPVDLLLGNAGHEAERSFRRVERDAMLRAEAPGAAGVISLLDLGIIQVERAGRELVRLQTLVRVQQAVGDLEDAMQRPADLPVDPLPRNPQ